MMTPEHENMIDYAMGLAMAAISQAGPDVKRADVHLPAILWRLVNAAGLIAEVCEFSGKPIGGFSGRPTGRGYHIARS